MRAKTQGDSNMTLFKTTIAAIASRCAIAFGLMLLAVTAVWAQPTATTDHNCQQQGNNQGDNKSGCFDIYAANSYPFGLSYGEWSAKWWQWVYSIPLEKNPQYQGTVQPPKVPVTIPVDCTLGKSGPVWFLGASFGGFAVRECKGPLPSDVSLFFPVANTYFGVIGFDCIDRGSFAAAGGYPTDHLPVNHCFDEYWQYPDLGIYPPSDRSKIHSYDDLVAYVASGLNAPPEGGALFTAYIDNVPVRNLADYRAKASIFTVTTPSSNVLGYNWGFSSGDWSHGTGVADLYYPNGSDGYWLMIKPLGPGRHTVRFTAGNTSATPPIFLDVTYGFTVAPDQKH
jgi:hypothetical protein